MRHITRRQTIYVALPIGRIGTVFFTILFCVHARYHVQQNHIARDSSANEMFWQNRVLSCRIRCAGHNISHLMEYVWSLPVFVSALNCFNRFNSYFVSAVVFLVGIPLYRRETINREDGSMILRFIDCIWYGIKRRLRGCTIANLTDSPWIDGSVEKYPESFVREVSAFMKLLKLCIPLTLYWTLFTQIDSNWTFQASQLNTNVLGVKFEADQVNSYSNAYSTKCATQIINFDCVSLVGQRSRCIAFIAHDSFLEICMRTVAGQVRCGIVAAEIDGFGRTVCHAIVCMCRSVTA